MALKTEPFEINGVTVEITQLGYFRSQRLLTRLLRLAGPALLSIATVAAESGGKAALKTLADADVQDLMPALAGLFERMEPETVEAITKELLSTAVVRGEKPVALLGVIDAVLGGDFWGVVALQAFAIKVHFGNFSSARAAFGQLGLTVEASPSSESTT